mmetsp:Transcript_917/g.821  ORF Transcript_917/g.821 Transcript_917/m.821 type:complete len:126 (-) Transcript_917:475-852(-)
MMQGVPEESEEKESTSNPTSPIGIKGRKINKPIDDEDDKEDDILKMITSGNLTRGRSGQIDEDGEEYDSENDDDYETPFMGYLGNTKKRDIAPNGKLIRQGSRSKTSYEIPIWQHEQVKQQEEYQ